MLTVKSPLTFLFSPSVSSRTGRFFLATCAFSGGDVIPIHAFPVGPSQDCPAGDFRAPRHQARTNGASMEHVFGYPVVDITLQGYDNAENRTNRAQFQPYDGAGNHGYAARAGEPLLGAVLVPLLTHAHEEGDQRGTGGHGQGQRR